MESKAIKELEKIGKFDLNVNGDNLIITLEDVEIFHEDIKGWLVETDNEITVALDAELTDELINEGFAREFVNRVQNMRKDAGFEVTDRIFVYYQCSDRLKKAIENLNAYVSAETLAEKINPTLQTGDFSAEWDINGELCQITVKRIR